MLLGHKKKMKLIDFPAFKFSGTTASILIFNEILGIAASYATAWSW